MARQPSEKKVAEVYAICEAYLSDPNNVKTDWTHISREVFKKKSANYVSMILSVEQRQELWANALQKRREYYAPLLSKVDQAVLDSAALGDVPAAKLAYQRFEAWAPAEKQVHEGGDKAITVNHGITPAIQDKLDELYKSK